jgi:hypothetical protein
MLTAEGQATCRPWLSDANAACREEKIVHCHQIDMMSTTFKFSASRGLDGSLGAIRLNELPFLHDRDLPLRNGRSRSLTTSVLDAKDIFLMYATVSSSLCRTQRRRHVSSELVSVFLCDKRHPLFANHKRAVQCLMAALCF